MLTARRSEYYSSMRNTPAQIDLQMKHPERGSSLIEYALLCAMIAIVSIVAVMELQIGIESKLNRASDQIDGSGVVYE